MARAPTQEEIAAFIVGHGIVDFVSGGKLSKVERDAIWKVVKRLGPPVATGVGRAALSGAGAVGTGLGAAAYGVGRLGMRGALPLTMAMSAADAYRMGVEDGQKGPEYALQNVPLFPLVNPQFAEDVGIPGGGRVDVLTPGLATMKALSKRKRKISAYSKNVGKAMKAVKASKRGGSKGKLSNPKGTFKTVSKTVSKIMKGGKRPRGGITGIISKAVKGTFKRTRKPKKTRSSRKRRGY